MNRSFRRGLTGLAALLACAGCGTNNDNEAPASSNYGQFFQLVRQSWAAQFGKVRITRKQAADIPFASMGYRVDGGNEQLIVLATDTGGDLLWTSKARIVLVTRDARIVRTVGLEHDLSALTAGSGGIPSPAAAIKAPFSSTRLEDFPDLGRYGAALSCRAVAVGRQTISILGHSIAVMRVNESCQSRALNWSFVDSYWVALEDGYVWRSLQHVHPRGGEIETEIFRPPG